MPTVAGAAVDLLSCSWIAHCAFVEWQLKSIMEWQCKQWRMLTGSLHEIGRVERVFAGGAGETGAVEEVVSSWHLIN